MASTAPSSDVIPPPAVPEPRPWRRRLKSWIGVHPPQPWLSRKELKERVARSPTLVKEIYEIVQRQMLAETGRQARLDAKATSLLSAVGLCLTVVFTFGSLLLTQTSRFNVRLGGFAYALVTICFALAILFGFGAGGLALRSLFVRGTYVSMGEGTVFSDEALSTADEEVGKNPDIGLACYRRYIVVQMWDIVRTHSDNHERKAIFIKLGQCCFAAFLSFMFVISFSIVVTIKYDPQASTDKITQRLNDLEEGLRDLRAKNR